MFSLHRGFEDTSFNNLSGIGITDILLNIVSCYGFIQDNNSTLILTRRIILVSYYLPNFFVTIEKYSKALKNALISQNRVHAINMYNRDSIMIWSNPITSFVNTLKNIYIGGTILGEFTSTYYDDNNYDFGMLFQQYTASVVESIYH